MARKTGYTIRKKVANALSGTPDARLDGVTDAKRGQAPPAANPNEVTFGLATRRALLALCLALLTVPSGGRASGLLLDELAQTGLVDFGDRIPFETIAPCAAVDVWVDVRAGAGVESGAVTDACSGTVQVPRESELVSVSPEEVTEFIVRAESATWPDSAQAGHLRPKRVQPEHAPGELTVTPVTDDPFGGGDAVDIVASPSRLSLGVLDLTGISSIALRASARGGRTCLSTTYCRGARVVATALAPDGPMITAWDVPTTDPARPWNRVVSEPLRIHPAEPVEVFLTIVGTPDACPALDTPVLRCDPAQPYLRLNYVEFIGSGVAAPHTFEPDQDGFVTLFDGTSLADWQTAGCCGFVVEPDGSMRTLGGYGLSWYSARRFADFELRLEFKVDSPDANSGIFVRFPDPGGSPTQPSADGYEVQVQDYGQAYPGSSDLSQTGAIYSFQPAERIPTSTVGAWNTVQITVIGQSYVVELNGRVVNQFQGSRLLEGYIGMQMHDPSGTVWYRNVRARPL